MVQGDLSHVYTITFWSEHGLRLERCHFVSARHCTFTLIFLPCRFKNRPRTEHGCCTGAIFTAHTDFFHVTARLSVYTFVKAVTARLIVVPRPTYLVVLVTAKNLGTGAEAAPFTLSEFAVPCRKKTAPVPKY